MNIGQQKSMKILKLLLICATLAAPICAQQSKSAAIFTQAISL
jgi:hypothetical protein